jgi:pimeloyl-[acyl-carrier protein] methyl ester esterase
MLFLNGWAADERVWQELNELPSVHMYHFLMEDSLSDVHAYLDWLCQQEGKVDLVGWSMGGMLALELAAKYPEKISRLMIISSTAKFVQDKEYVHGVPLGNLQWLRRSVRKNSIQAQEDFYQQMFADGELIDLSKFEPEAMVESKEALLSGLNYLEKTDLRNILRDIKVPVHILHGEKDAICPVEAAVYMKEYLLDCKLTVFEGCGHIPFFTKVDKCRTIMRGDGFI